MPHRLLTWLPTAAFAVAILAFGPWVQGSGADDAPRAERLRRARPASPPGERHARADAPPASSPRASTPRADDAPDAPRPASAQRPVRVRAMPVHSRIGPREVAHMREVIGRARTSHPDVFAKMGGSSIASHAFLHCFASDDVDLDVYDELEATLAYFRGGRAQRGSPFGRDSLATQVGWSLRQGLGGRPPRVLREVQAIHPRYALAFFGGNDVMARNPRRFGERLLALVDLLESQGVVPILGATLPRRDSRQMDEWSRRYNRISQAIAQARGLPYIDFYQAFAGLPVMGLARDGVHPNVHRDGRRFAPCHLDREGLQRGQNVRNLLTLQSLDRLHRALDGGGAPDRSLAAPAGRGTARDPVRVEGLPFAEIFRASAAPSDRLEEYGGCWRARGRGPERVYRIVTDRPVALDISVLGVEGADANVYLVDESGDPDTCVKGGRGEMWVEVPVGTWHVVVEIDPPRRGRDLEGDLLVVVTPAV